ncbi:hypothetical protein JRO89_XS14G0143000 [Xanthoceras sorbifolium]|uniref:Mediator-associated protein 2 n=1 Tax=Xanthoceras sorbifolium TaxID=99658 RepID=A0ABQ8H5A4_9ROSI|nr:hypothetical protein JRO89_XS14G0143000 [Xanthoceras sorbifolium]
MSLSEGMDDDYIKEGYKPTEEYEEELRDPLVDISLTDSTELWLIQWPYKQVCFLFFLFYFWLRFFFFFSVNGCKPFLSKYLRKNPDFDGKELSLELHGSGRLGSFEDSSGKTYDVLSFDSQEPDATVFLTSASEPKIVGKISRRVSLVHYPDPKELEELNPNNLRKLYSTSSGITLSNSSHRFSTPTQSSRQKNSRGHPAPTYSHSSRHKSSLSELGEPSSKSEKRKRVQEPNRSTDRSTLDLIGGHSGTTFSGSSEHSHKGKSKKKTKADE